VRATAETVSKPPDPLPAAGIEETERIADWLEQPGTRLIEITGDWMWPLHAVLDHEALVHYALGEVAAEPPAATLQLRASEMARRRTEEKRAEALFLCE
jgi:DNA polymerase-3 subunit epsilon